MKEARFYDKLSEGGVQCLLCPYQCPISPSRHGKCGVRLNRNGKLYNKTYGRLSMEKAAPVETIPLYHFHPGSTVLLVGGIGCTMHCPFCNTWRISQAGGARTRLVPPEDLAALAEEKGASGVVFGVNEPVVCLEYILDAAPLIREAGRFIAVATNGLISQKPLFELLPLVDAFLVDLKGFDDRFYQNVCGGIREEILRNIVTINIRSHLEISGIIIGGTNDGEPELDRFFQWVANLQPCPPPLHLIRYFPDFQYREPPATDPMRMYYLQEMARRILPFVYLSNMEEREANVTYCPSCKAPCIIRETDRVEIRTGKDNSCPECGEKIPIVT